MAVAIGLTACFAPLASAQGGSAFTVELMQPISTRANKKGDQVIAKVVSPAQLAGAIMTGNIKESKSGGSVKKESVLNFGFNTLHYQKMQVPVNADVTRFYNSKKQADVDEEGQIISKKNNLAQLLLMAAIGAGVGAGVGAAAAGSEDRGRGAAIGAGAGAGAGTLAGFLFVRFGAKAPNISFDPGSIFELAVSDRR
jgi:hypothetical protein